MDDFVIANLSESRNEWCSHLVSIFTPLIREGLRSIFNESWKLCIDNDEATKYLMTFQNLLSRVPKWNNNIIEEEKKRIIERSGCDYLEDLITCVHIIQLKILTCIRVGNKQKKIDITIPKLDAFIHKVYINVARKVYANVYLFEKKVNPLQQQRNNRELEQIIEECIMNSIRESIPTEAIIRAYMDESIEQEEEVIIETIEEKEEELPIQQSEPISEITADKIEEVTQEPIENKLEEEEPVVVPTIKNIDDEKVTTTLSFNNIDSVLDELDTVKKIEAPKTIEHLEELSSSRAMEKMMEEDAYESDDEKIQIDTQNVNLTGFDVLDDPPSETKRINTDDIVLNDIEELI
jgi:hypothetical protein